MRFKRDLLIRYGLMLLDEGKKLPQVIAEMKKLNRKNVEELKPIVREKYESHQEGGLHE